MNILIVTPIIPFPLTEGGKVAQFSVLKGLSDRHNVHILLEENCKNDTESINNLQLILPRITIHREISRKDNSLRSIIFTLLRILKDNFFPSGANKVSINFPIHYEPSKSQGYIERMVSVIENEKIDLVQIDFYPFIDLVYAIPSHVPKIFIHHEIRYIRTLNEINTIPNLNKIYVHYILEKIRNHENKILSAYDAVFVFSDVDKMYIEAQIPSTSCIVSPFGLSADFFKPIYLEEYKINKISFIGGSIHPPNVDAAKWFSAGMYEPIFKETLLPFEIVGAWDQATKQQIKQHSLLKFIGSVQNIDQQIENSVLVVPLRIGSGIRTKILHAMAIGVPVISTSKGAEGLNVVDGEELLIADNGMQFLKAILMLMKDEKLLFSVRKKARLFVEKNYSEAEVSKLRCNAIEKIYNDKVVTKN
jgi:glycosyltransferase involved in cell wall biosynthesis